MRTLLLVVALCACQPPPQALRLRKVVLYQNGIGYFERSGAVARRTLHVPVRKHELDDVLKTLTVIDRGGGRTLSARLLGAGLDVQLSAPSRDLQVAYAVPTPTWKATYRVVLDEREALLQGWALVNNAGEEDWNAVELTLATGAPLTFAVDLHTPEFVPRPDLTGRMVQPSATGAVESERAHAGPDRDADGIADVMDRCPEAAESWNGGDDEDGCPDRGRVVVSEASIQVLEAIYFASRSEEIPAEAAPLLDAIAATLQGNPEIVSVDVVGHAGDDEEGAWELSSRRAAAVKRALVTRGVTGARLRLTPAGATRPLDDHPGSPKNRRVDFTIARRSQAPAAGPVEAGAVERSVAPAALPRQAAGTVRYRLADPVSIPRGGQAMVAILNRRVPGADVFLYRPDPNAPGSDRHPFRAVRLVNRSGFTVEPGPVAIFARGAFVGEGLLQRLHEKESAFVPYAVDGSADVRVEVDEESRPHRVVALSRGVLTVEDTARRVTTYHVDTGADPPERLWVRHARAPGYQTKDLPPGSESAGDGQLIPVPLAPHARLRLEVVETQPRRQSIEILEARGADLALYLPASSLDGDAAARLQKIVTLRRELASTDAEIERLREDLEAGSTLGSDVRDSLKTVEKTRGAEPLRQKLLARLGEITNAADDLSRKLGARLAARAELRSRLALELESFVID
jgi:outer membrane protein OmpA-like peptidoglycan-associated protein